MKPSPRLRLVEARKDRQWSQQEVADRLGTTQHNVSRWERGATTPTAYFQARLCSLFDKTPQQLGLVEQAPQFSHASAATPEESAPTPVPSPEEASTLWAVPYPRNPFFLGRDKELAQIRHCLQAGQVMALSQPQAISGLGGVGKTQLALEYAYRFAQDYQVVLWTCAESTEALISSYVAFATLLALPEREEQEHKLIVEAVKRWLHTHHDWLLILDNADELEILPDFLPPLLRGHLLITTRVGATGRLTRRVEIEILSPGSGALLLLRRAGLLAPDAELSQASPEEQALAMQIAEELGGLPLALDQAGAYLEETGIALVAYWQLYQQHRARLFAERRGGFVADHPLPVATTWSVSFQRIAARNPAAADLLRLLAWLPADAIAEEIFSAGAAFLGPVLAPIAGDALLFNEAIEALRSASLIKRDPKTRTLSLHRLVQAVLQDQQNHVEWQTWTERVVLAVNAAFPHAEYETWLQCERLLPLALSAAAHIEHQQMRFEEAGRLLFETASYLHDRARYDEAEPLYEQALSIREQILGPEHLDVAYSLNNLAVLFWKQGKYMQAELLCQQALSIREQLLGPEHPDVARSLHNLALFSDRQGKFETAILCYQQALHIQEQHLGSEHPDVAYSLNNLAGTYIEQGRYVDAELLYRRALSIWEQQLGPEHPLVASPLIGLGILYTKQGWYADAELLYQRALSIEEQQLGPEHPDVASTLTCLGVLYTEQGRYADAELLYQQALRIQEQQLRPEHPSTADTLHEFATLRERQGNRLEALALYRRALTIRKQALGSAHPKTTETRTCVIPLLLAVGLHEEAVRLKMAT